MAKAFTITSATFSSPRHTTHYWAAGVVGKNRVNYFVIFEQ
jgi:hypothetical protein